ncbi:MAG TPA: class D sortase, partial [Ruminococcus sp.]|nr:class D sortase [Ruminococcus sp.]
LILCYTLTPAHTLQKYLNIAFMDNLKTTEKTAGLQILENDIDTTGGNGETYDTGKIIYPTFGEQYAVLSAPAIDLTVSVYYGVNEELLERGACQSTQSAIIGETGNTVIDAHVNTYFSDLSKLREGDEVLLYTKYGNFTFRVARLIAFDKNDKRFLTTTDEQILTLYTCQPQVIGSPDQRLGVQCIPVSSKFYEQE